MKILIIEDEHYAAKRLTGLIQSIIANAEILETLDSVEESIKWFQCNNEPDLIFMDMRMPNMDGLEATRKIRTLPNVGRGLPIIALTANAFDDDRNACFDSGMNDFMTKPVSAEELSEKVRDWTSEETKERLRNAA